jgi:hypothetical protein
MFGASVLPPGPFTQYQPNTAAEPARAPTTPTREAPAARRSGPRRGVTGPVGPGDRDRAQGGASSRSLSRERPERCDGGCRRRLCTDPAGPAIDSDRDRSSRTPPGGTDGRAGGERGVSGCKRAGGAAAPVLVHRHEERPEGLATPHVGGIELGPVLYTHTHKHTHTHDLFWNANSAVSRRATCESWRKGTHVPGPRLEDAERENCLAGVKDTARYFGGESEG